MRGLHSPIPGNVRLSEPESDVSVRNGTGTGAVNFHLFFKKSFFWDDLISVYVFTLCIYIYVSLQTPGLDQSYIGSAILVTLDWRGE